MWSLSGLMFAVFFSPPRFRPSRRPIPMPQPDYRIHEMNKRLQQRTDDSDNLWWDAFATEFFEDDANLTLTFCLEDGPKRYSNEAQTFAGLAGLFLKKGQRSTARIILCYLFYRYWPYTYTKVFPKHIRRGCDGLAVRTATSKGVFS